MAGQNYPPLRLVAGPLGQVQWRCDICHSNYPNGDHEPGSEFCRSIEAERRWKTVTP